MNQKRDLEYYRPLFEFLVERIKRQILIHKETVIIPEQDRRQQGKQPIKGSKNGNS